MKGTAMSKIKDASMTVVWTYVAAASIVGLARLTVETVDYVKERKAKKNKKNK